MWVSEMEISICYSIEQIFTSPAPTKSNVREKAQIRSLSALPGPYWCLTEPITNPNGPEETWFHGHTCIHCVSKDLKVIMVSKNSSSKRTWTDFLACHFFVNVCLDKMLKSLDSFFHLQIGGFVRVNQNIIYKGWHKMHYTHWSERVWA